MSARILVLAGTAEAGSPDHRLAFEAARLLAQTSVMVTMVGLADFPLPLLDVAADPDRSAPPAAALQLAERLGGADALLLVSPDANGSVPPLPKNAVDWAARVRRVRDRPVRPFRGLVVALASASPGRSGAFRALDAWRQVFADLGAEVLTRQLTLSDGDESEAHGLFAGDAAAELEGFVADLVEKAQALGRHAP